MSDISTEAKEFWNISYTEYDITYSQNIYFQISHPHNKASQTNKIIRTSAFQQIFNHSKPEASQNH